MKTIEQEDQGSSLDDELQELYLLSKHWTSDISFAADEVRFLKHMLEKYPVRSLSPEQIVAAKNIKQGLAQLDEEIQVLQTSVISLLKFIDPFIIDPNKIIGVDLIENFFSLEKEIKTLFATVKELKKSLFVLMEVELREERV